MSVLSKNQVFYSPKSFLSFYKMNTNLIESVRVIPPKLGQRGYGKFKVVIRTDKKR